MRILLVTEFFPSLDEPIFSGGVETRIYYTATRLVRTHTVIVLAQLRKGEKRHEIKGNLTIHRLGISVNSEAAGYLSLPMRLIFVWQCFWRGLKMRADIIEGSNYVVFLPTFLIGWLKKIPKVAWYPDVLVGQWRKHFGWLLGGIGEIVERFVSRLPWDQLITISNSARQRLISIGVSESKVEVIGCGVDMDKRQETRDKRQEKRKQLIIVSRLVSYKRVDWGIKLLAALGSEFSDYCLVIVGKGPEERDLRLKIKDLGLEKRAMLKQCLSREKLYKEIARSMVLIHPSLIEGFGIVLLEAAALGTPFVAADIPTSLELKQSLKSGLVFEKNCFEDFVDKTKELLASHDLWERYRIKGLENSAKYDWETVSLQTEKIYKHWINSYLTLT